MTDVKCTCKLIGMNPVAYDHSTCPTHGPNTPRYFVDHGMIHDRITGKHVEIEEAASIMSMPPDESSLMAWKTVIEIGKRWQETAAELEAYKTLGVIDPDDAAKEVAEQRDSAIAANAKLIENESRLLATIERLEGELNHAIVENLAFNVKVSHEINEARAGHEASIRDRTRLKADYDQISDENARLREERDAVRRTCATLTAERDGLRAECERMRFLVKDATGLAHELLTEFHDNDPEADLHDDFERVAEIRRNAALSTGATR